MKNSHLLSVASALLAVVVTGCGLMGGESTRGSDADYTAADSATYMRSSADGEILTTPDGRTVYTYDKDSSGVSSCYNECAEKWPPVTAASDARPVGRMTIIERTDGTRQWAYNGMPLYLYQSDSAAGDVTGDDVGGVWHVVR